MTSRFNEIYYFAIVKIVYKLNVKSFLVAVLVNQQTIRCFKNQSVIFRAASLCFTLLAGFDEFYSLYQCLIKFLQVGWQKKQSEDTHLT